MTTALGYQVDFDRWGQGGNRVNSCCCGGRRMMKLAAEVVRGDAF